MWITVTTARFFSNNGYIFQTTGTTWNNWNNFFCFLGIRVLSFKQLEQLFE